MSSNPTVRQGFQSFGWDCRNPGPLSQYVWHVKEPSLKPWRLSRSKFAAVTGNGDSCQIAEKIARAAVDKQTNSMVPLDHQDKKSSYLCAVYFCSEMYLYRCYKGEEGALGLLCLSVHNFPCSFLSTHSLQKLEILAYSFHWCTNLMTTSRVSMRLSI
jgi:hypothetical protein